MTATAPASRETLTLPKLAIRLGINLDFVRRQFKTNSELARLARTVGHSRFVEEEDVERVRELLTAAAAKG